jgi:predicted chitinase
MTSTSIEFRYPFLGKDLKEIKDPQAYYSALSGMSGGFFPLGANGFPHGGIHFGDATTTKLVQATGVRCILDGEVVAYRLNNSYPHLNYSNGKKAAYSTSFVLVRHCLTLPPAPTAKASAAPAPTDGQDIYSLYMHLASWTEYLSDGALERPAYWKGNSAFRIGKKDQQVSPATGPQGWGAQGSFVSSDPKDGKAREHVGFLPEGSEVLIGSERDKWGHIEKIVSGGMISPVAGGAFGSDDMNVPWEIPEWRAKEEPSATTAQGDWGWIYLPDQKSVIEPDPQNLDRVFTLDKPYPVEAGSFLGHIGEYQRFREGTPLPPTPRRPLLHLEVFAGDSFAAFLTTSRSRAAQLPAEEQSLFVISPGTQLVAGEASSDQVLTAGLRIEPSASSPTDGRWAKVQTRKPDPHAQGGFGAPSSAAIWIERSKLGSLSTGLHAWSSFPLRTADVKDPANGFSLVIARAQLDALDEQSRATDDKGVHWWRVSFGTKAGESKFGWVCEKGHPGTQWQSPWAWPGFSIVDATAISVVDCFKRNLSTLGATDFTEQQEFKPSAASVNNSELMLALEQAIDAQGNKDGRVNATELQNALRKPWLAQSLSHLILRYESEWGGSMSRWDALTPLMKESKKTWLGELERIKKLQWWDDVANKVAEFPKSPTVFHINPIGLVGNFFDPKRINIAKFVALYKKAHSENFGWYESAASSKTILPPLSSTSEANLYTLMRWIDALYVSKGANFSVKYVAYMLATSRIESYDFHTQTFFGPFVESISYDKAERDYGCGPTATNPERAKKHHNTEIGDGFKYRGRGLVQITWKENYENFAPILGVDLVGKPENAVPWKNAATVMVEGMIRGIFTGRKLADYLSEARTDYVGARRIINGTDKSKIFAEYAEKFEILLKECT